MPLVVSTASSTFNAVTGFNLAAVTTWMSQDLIGTVLGTVLAIFIALWPWILATLLIGSVLSIAFYGFRFFRH